MTGAASRASLLNEIGIFLRRSPRENADNGYALWLRYFLVSVLLFDLALSLLIVLRVPYTEIDWVAYMQQVESFLGGERDYRKIEGCTGPLVYPAVFLYLFSLLHCVTDEGKDIARGQFIFVLIYIANVSLVLGMYSQSQKVPTWALCLLCLSRRVHSVYLLRLFNDGVCMAFLHASALLLLRSGQVGLSCVFFSLAVGSKMSALLYAPGLLLVLLQTRGAGGAACCLLVCAIVQVVAAAPFLQSHSSSYFLRAFEFGRVFKYEYTLNFRFLDEKSFTSKGLAVTLLVCTVASLGVFGAKVASSDRAPRVRLWARRKLNADYTLYVLFISNFIGVTFARSIHFQFYSWYFHSIPFLLWATDFPVTFKLLALASLELCYNVYPATTASSLLMQATHLVILAGLWRSSVPPACSLASDEGKAE